MVTGIPPLVLKWLEYPPPLKYPLSPGHQSVALRHLSTSSSVISQNGFIAGAPSFLLLSRTVKAGRARVDEVDDTVFAGFGQVFARHAFHCVGAPVRSHVAEYGRGVGQQMPEQHGCAVERVVLGCEHVRRAFPVPVERRAQDGFHEICVGEMVCPLALPLEPARDRVMPHTFFIISHGFEFVVARPSGLWQSARISR